MTLKTYYKDKLEPFLKDRKNRPVLVVLSWLVCILLVIVHHRLSEFDINRLERQASKQLKKDQKLDIDALSDKLDELGRVVENL